MRHRVFTAFALIALFLPGSTVWGQTGSSSSLPQYSWRADGTHVAPPRVISHSVGYYQKEQEGGLQDAQPSLSDQVVPAPKPASPESVVEKKSVAAPAPAESAPDISQPFADPPATGAPEVRPALSIPQNVESPAPNYCCRDCRRDWCHLGCKKKLFKKRCSGLDIGGWTSLGYHNRNTPIFNDRKGEVNLHQNWLYLDKPSSTSGNGIGYRVDLVYGIDAQNTQAFGNSPPGAPSGWDNAWDFGAYGWALPQAYLQYNNGGPNDIKIGKFFAPVGYESVPAVNNFFYSHSYTLNYSEPFTLSGLLVERQQSDCSSIIYGATLGWDTAFKQNQGGFMLLFGRRYQLNEFVDIETTALVGDSGSRGSGTFSSSVAKVQLTESLRYVGQFDYVNLEDNQEFGLVQYLFRDVSDCVALGARLEWWKSDQLFPNTKSTYEFTMGANIRPNANVTLRPEIRWDWGAGAVDRGATIIGVDAVMTY